MITTIKLPMLAMSMSEGTIVEWFVENGGRVEAGNQLYAVETEKSIIEVEATVSGVLRHLASTGDTLPVGADVAEIIGSD
jgi:pyruvate/2-oxoglutarate dehydrogenase complex dihydrolipoamide acyltransferase (E2) component